MLWVLNTLSVLLFLVLAVPLKCLQSEFSVIIEPKNRECFYQVLDQNMNVFFDYQVIQGGDLDISFWLSSPSNRIIISDLKKNIGQNNFRTDETGEYRFCFDNSFSHFATKQVFFYLYSPDPFVDHEFPVDTNKPDEASRYEVDDLSELQMKLEQFNDSFTKVYSNLEQAQRLMATYRVYEQIDRVIMEFNYDRVNFWSLLNIFIMLCVGIIQVFLIRALFEDRSKIGKLLRSGKSS